VIACDSPYTVKKLCSKAEIFVNIISDSNRFILSFLNTEPHHLKIAKGEIAKVLREFTGPCKLLLLESIEESRTNIKKQKHVDMHWYAINPTTKRSCKVDEYSENALLLTSFKTASAAMIVLAVAIAVGALVGICVTCLYYMRNRVERHSKDEYPNINQIPKFGAIFLTSPPTGSSHDMLYETQMLEMPMGEEDSMIKPVGKANGISAAAHSSNSYDLDLKQSYQNYARNALTDKKLSVEENMFSVSERSGLHPQKNKYIGF
ncbi:Bmc7 protein, partial [Wuchereria bancrofti]